MSKVFIHYAVKILGVAFILAGANHFLNPSFYTKIMPDYLPAHLMLVYLSGLFEILGGLGVLIRWSQKWAGIGLILLIAAVFPANIHMALHAELYSDFPAWGLYLRLPLQFLLLGWAYLSLLDAKNKRS